MTAKLLIIFGISGVGKTTLCASYARKHEGVIHYSASALLGLDRSTSHSRSIEDALQDQQRLVGMVGYIRKVMPENLILLDAHCRVKTGGTLLTIPVEVIGAMDPSGFIFVKALSQTVLSRRMNRGDESYLEPECVQLEKEQLAQLDIVEGYSITLNVSLVIVEVDQVADLTDAVASFR